MKLLSAWLSICLVLSHLGFSQSLKSWDPAVNNFPVTGGQAWPAETDTYKRFPGRAKQTVADDVWKLSENSTGLYIRFKTNASSISVKYAVTGTTAFPHMPATGVSGLDLYGLNPDGKWFWFPGRYAFKDTISYNFTGLLSRDDSSGRNFEYRLYLPLYNTIKWMQINYDDTKQFEPLPLRLEKPIVVYGTSIAQGGCAGRPGLAWTSILERDLDRPLINLGFSGSGRLEDAVLDLMGEIDAKIYLLDCLPNMIGSKELPDEEVARRIVNAVDKLQRAKPGVPIILSEHSAGNTNSGTNNKKNGVYESINRVMQQTFEKMKAEGVKNIYLLSNEAIGFNMHSTVDGEHPNDIGMQQNAAAYEKIIRHILHEPVGTLATTIPVPQSRDHFYFMPERHSEVIAYNRKNKPETVFIGNSIVHMWGGNPASSISEGTASWDEIFKPANTVNMGFGWDRIENVLWRVYHDELDDFRAKRIIVMIGTNNIGLNTDDEILAGLENLYTAIRHRQPDAVLQLVGILPRRNNETRVKTLNNRIAALARKINAHWADPGKVLLNGKSVIDETLFSDGLHPNTAGYKKLGVEFRKILKK